MTMAYGAVVPDIGGGVGRRTLMSAQPRLYQACTGKAVPTNGQARTVWLVAGDRWLPPAVLKILSRWGWAYGATDSNGADSRSRPICHASEAGECPGAVSIAGR